MEKFKSLLPFFLLLIISVAIIVLLFPIAHQYGGISLPMDGNAIITHSQVVLDDLKIDYTALQPDIKLVSNRSIVRQIQTLFGIEESNRLLRDSVSGYYWEVHWRKRKSMIIWSGDKTEVEDVNTLLKGDIEICLDQRGRVVEFERKIGDSVRIPSLSSTEAKVLASSFLKRYTSVADFIDKTTSSISEKHIQQLNRNDHEFIWTTRMPVLSNKLDIKVTVAGNLVAKFTLDSNVPAEYTKFDSHTIIKIIKAILVVLFGIAILVVAFQRIRSYEIGFRLAFFMGILTAIVYDIEMYLNMREMSGWDIIVPLIIVPIFVGGSLVILFAVGESLLRETWKEKMASFDLISKGYLFHSRIGQNVIRGLAIGLSSFALWLFLVYAINLHYPLWITPTDSEPIHTFDTGIPSLYVLSHSFFDKVFIFAFFVLFGMSFLHRYISSAPLLLGVSALATTIISMGEIGPLVPAIIIQAMVITLLFWTFYRYDAIASFIALFIYGSVKEIGGLFIAGNQTFTTSAWMTVGFFAMLFIVSVASLLRRKEITDFDEITPAFAKHITERQRLQQELEIARTVQMSFLPKTNPSIPQFDIASRCAPALEIGGDYYDFIEMEGKKLAVAIGDVSGKGTQAAFYMTLTKGFLRALAKVSESPAKILTQVNHLFYENVGRGIFVSMIYGVFDIERKTLTVARAGHNPVIMRKSQAKNVHVINPAGLALGLDGGSIFAKSIQEMTFDYQPGDLFIFYTDGFPEAMNKNREEFGEGRLANTIEKLADKNASEVMDGIFAEMKSFIGKAQQHDDMTIVVIKVKA